MITMKTTYRIIGCVLPIFFLIGCNSIADIEPEEFGNNQISFTSISTKGVTTTKDPYGNPHSDRNILEVPDTVGVFVKKAGSFIMQNALYRITNYKSDNFLSKDTNDFPSVDFRPGGTPNSVNEEQLLWYKTSNGAAYWDKNSTIIYDFFAYAPAVETNKANDYYKIDENGIVNFKIDEKVGLPVDFIYAKKDSCTNTKADSLHLFFKHKLTKMVFRLKNSTENAITCYGVKYKIKYPIATFNLITDKWAFSGSDKQIEVKRYAQYEVFRDSIVNLPELTTLLFPTHATNLASGSVLGNVIIEFQVCLNNKWYNMKTKLDGLNLQYTEGKLIELTFDCNLKYGENHNGDELWNIFVATFDSFEEGGSINGILK